MTQLSMFNVALGLVPSSAKNLEQLIRLEKWPEEKSRQAIDIVRQLQKCTNMLEPYVTGTGVGLRRLKIVLSPEECGIDGLFEEENMLQAIKYVENLLADINFLSADIVFSYGGHDNSKSTECEFKIAWEI